MATSLLALLDDVATILDDVSVMTKVAAKKTAGVLGDDLALNAQQVSGVQRRSRAAGGLGGGQGLADQQGRSWCRRRWRSARFAPWLVTPLLMVGGAFLCYEGFEKLAHRFLHSREEDAARRAELARRAARLGGRPARAVEKDKIKGAVRTDFVLSAEIIVITLGTVSRPSR